MMVVPFLTPLIGHVIKSLAEKASKLVTNKLFKKKKIVHGTVETKFPRVEGVGNPWLAPTMYNQAHKTNPINFEVEFDENRLQGLIKLSVPLISSSQQVWS